MSIAFEIAQILADVITTSGFSRHLGFAHVCQQWHCSAYVHYFLRPRTHACWKSTDILFLSRDLTASGFGRDHDTILVISGVDMFHVVVFVFVEFVDTYVRSLSIRKLSFVSHTAVKYVIFWRQPPWIYGGYQHHAIPEVAPLKSLKLKSTRFIPASVKPWSAATMNTYNNTSSWCILIASGSIYQTWERMSDRGLYTWDIVYVWTTMIDRTGCMYTYELG